jgi:hypothetical protein
MIYKCLEHGLKGQNILARGNVLGKSISMKIVCEIQFENAENVIRTELYLLILKKRDFSNFVRNYCKTLNHEMHGRFKPFGINPGRCPGLL